MYSNHLLICTKDVHHFIRNGSPVGMVEQEQKNASAPGVDSTVGESSPAEGTQAKDKTEEIFGPLGFNIHHIPVQDEHSAEANPHLAPSEFHLEDGVEALANVEHQFIPNLIGCLPIHQNDQQNRLESKSLSALRNGADEDICVSLQLGDREPKRRRSECIIDLEEPK
ncbi:hypothetical protein NE237_003765 [Protea cynaroides]|uniref:Uncharacterized protein n=1 Tax=Protea cynaroides TaxID=273540 RepID=A0A9Q0KI03_9MAGN|nr:hypothetical protein NE237_003765 [Protea cynaroides]